MATMKLHKWDELKTKRLSPKKVAEIEAQAVTELEDEAIQRTLASLRKIRGMTQRKLADVIKTTQGEISRIEKNPNNKTSTVRAVVEALNFEFAAYAKYKDKKGRVHRVRLAI